MKLPKVRDRCNDFGEESSVIGVLRLLEDAGALVAQRGGAGVHDLDESATGTVGKNVTVLRMKLCRCDYFR